VATPGAAAQEAADRLVKAGVTSILNFAPFVLSVPPGVMVRKVDLAVELQILSYYEQRRAAAAASPVSAVSTGSRRGASA
jgi:redox-sensing transcriptional repressor